MNLLRLFGILLVAWFTWRTYRGIQKSRNERERTLAVRGAIAFWVLGGMFLAAMFVLPGKGRLLLAIPLVLIMGSAWKIYRNARREIRESTNLEAKLQRMKRVN